MKPLPEKPAHLADEPPPFLGSWRRVYLSVVLYLAAIIALFYAFTKTYRP